MGFIFKNLMKWNISVIRGKKTNKYSVSTGEGKWKKNKRNFFRPKENYNNYKNFFKKKTTKIKVLYYNFLIFLRVKHYMLNYVWI